jgi:putative PEP-CTERM system TPR-repeat lipoprotein
MSNRRPLQRILAAMLILSLAFAFSACERFKSADSLYRDAEARYQKGEQKAVIIQLKSALQKDPKHGPARLLSAKAYNDVGDFVAAEKEANKALELGMNADQAGLELARALLGQGQFQKALDAAKVSPGMSGEALAKVQVVRGDAQIGLRQIPAAKQAYAAAVQAAPDYFGGYLGNARLAALGGDAAQATRQIDLVLQKAPQSVEGLLLKGDLLAAQGKPDPAIAAYQAAIKANPNSAAAHFRLANLYLAQNKPDEVLREVQAGQKAEPGNLEGQYFLARNDFQQKKYSDARAHIQAVLRGAPDHLPSILLAGAISAALGETESAEKNLKRVINAIPGNAYARTLLAATYLQKGQTDLALESLAPLLQTDKPDERALSLAGQAYLAKGEVARAAELFDKARLANPQSAIIRTQLGAARLAQGESAQAIADLEAASAMDAKQSNADMVLILNYLQHKDYDKALSAIAILEKKQPDSPVPLNLRGGIHLAKGDVAAARASFEQALAKKADYLPAVQNLIQLDLRDKNIAAARKRYEGVLAKDKQSVGAMLGLAQMAALEKNEKEYGEWLNKAVAAKPDAIEPRALLADFYLKQKRPQDALRLATEAQSANPDNARALELLARVQFAVGDKESGLLSYQKLVQQNPQSAPAHYGLGLAQAAVDHKEDARAAWRKALQLQPAFYEAAAALAALDLRATRTEDALKTARDFQRANPKLASGFVLESEILAQQRNYDAAIQDLNKAQSLQAQSVVAARIHQLQLAAKRPAEADSGLKQWLNAHPNDFPASLYLAESYMARKQNKAAIAQYETVLKAQPDNVLVLNNLASLYQQEKDARALATAEHAYKLKPDLGPVADTLGWILVEQGQLARAVEMLRKAATAAPKNNEIGYHYAVALAKSGDKAAARKQLETILSSGQAFPQQDQAKALLKQL